MEYKEYITRIKKKYHPIIDEETGLIKKQLNRRPSMSVVSDAGKYLSNLQKQMSMTNYADVDEKSSSNGGPIPSIDNNLSIRAQLFLDKQ